MAARRPTSTTTSKQSTSPTRSSAGTAPASAGDPRNASARPRRRRRSGTGADKPSVQSPQVAVSNEIDEPAASVAPDNRSFAELGVPASLAAALAATGVTKPFPIQAATLPDSLAGKDVLGRGRTGSGKTYAFVLPVLARLAASGTKRRPNQPP